MPNWNFFNEHQAVIRPDRLRPFAFDDNMFIRSIADTEPTGKRGIDLFDLILSGIKEVYGVSSIIAGGSVRDHVAGNTHIKDVDVFLPLTWAKFRKGLHELGWSGSTALLPRDKEYKDCAVAMVNRGQSCVQGVVVDLIFRDKELTKEEVSLFPVYAQRCVYSLESGLMVSPEAKTDIENKTFTIDPTITDKERVLHVANKVKEWQKRAFYKDWKLVKPDVKEWWEDDEARII